MTTNSIIEIPYERVVNRIFFIRGKKVMFDKDLAELYGIETRTLNQAVKRNKDRFPDDFMFKLDMNEVEVLQQGILRSQFVILRKHGQHIKYAPFVFTEQGVAMLSSVLKSKEAVQVNIQIVRTFTKLREIISLDKNLAEKLELMGKKYDSQISDIFKVIKYLTIEKENPKTPIGFSRQ